MQSDALLLVVDIQNDFLPGGALAVERGHEVIGVINRIAVRFDNVLLTQDWHTAGHISFASSHAGKAPFSTIELDYGRQVLWPDHCVQGTHGAAFADSLVVPHAQGVIRKGYHAHTDSYSAFLEADRRTPTGLAGLLNERGSADGLSRGPGAGFLRRVERARCPPARVRGDRHRRCLPGDRHERLARCRTARLR